MVINYLNCYNLTMEKQYGRVSLKKASIALIPLYGFFLFILGYALKIKIGMNMWQIVISLLVVTFMLGYFLYKFYKKSLLKKPEEIKAENKAILDYSSITKGKMPNTLLGKWYMAAIVIAFIFPYFANKIYEYFGYENTDYVILLIGYVLIFIFIFGIFITRKKNK